MTEPNAAATTMPSLVEQLMEAAYIGRTLRDGDQAFMREVLRLEQVNRQYRQAFTAIKQRVGEPMETKTARERVVRDIGRWCDAALAMADAPAGKEAPDA